MGISQGGGGGRQWGLQRLSAGWLAVQYRAPKNGVRAKCIPREHVVSLDAIWGGGSGPALTKERIHPLADVRPSGGFVLLRGAPGQEVVVVRVGRAGSRVRAPSSNIYVFAQVAVAAGTVVEVIITRHSIVHQPGQQLRLVVRSLSARGISRGTVAVVVADVGHIVARATDLAATATQVINVNVNVSGSGSVRGIRLRTNYQLR